MGLITEEVDVSPCRQTKYYEELGYSIPPCSAKMQR